MIMTRQPKTLIQAEPLAACGGSHAAQQAHAVASPSCDQQMTAWGRKAAPATAALNKSEAAVERAADSEDVPAARSALERAGRDAVRMESTPIPQCVDPGAYYRKWLDRWTAAGDNARSRAA